MDSCRKYQSPTWLRQKYWDEGLNCPQIAALVGVDPSTVHRWMVQLNIPRRKQGENPSQETRRKMGRGHRGPKNANRKGGRYRMTQDYIHVWQPDHPHANARGYVREHRLVVEKALNRYLKPDELVHHINGIRDDNRLENLQLINHHRQAICPRCGWPMGNMEEYISANVKPNTP